MTADNSNNITLDLFSLDFSVSEVIVKSLGDTIYIPLSLLNLVPGGEAPCDIFLKSKLSATETGFVICCRGGEIFSGEWIKKLQDCGITWIYFHSQDQNRVLRYLHYNIRHTLQDCKISPGEKAARVYDVTLLWARQFYQDKKAQVSANLLLGLEFVDHLFYCIWQDQYHQDWLLELCRHDSMLYSHCLNTCLIGMAFTKYLGWPTIAIRDFGLGALLHDIGMIKLVPAVMSKYNRLSEEEIKLLKLHPTIGYRLLKAFSALGHDSLMIVLQHHESCNGSGYPEGLKGDQIDPAGKVMRVIDGYEALTHGLIRQQPLDPVKALWLMRQEWESQRTFDASYFSTFINFLS